MKFFNIIAAYSSALKYLILKSYNDFKIQLNRNLYVFSITAIIFLIISGYTILFNFYASLIIFIILGYLMRLDQSITNNIITLAFIYFLSFMVSVLISKTYDNDIVTTSVELNITSPVFEVTKDSNIILDKSNPKINIIVDDTKFVILKNSNCKNISKIKYISNNKDFSRVYSNTEYKIVCNGKEL